MKLVWQFVSFQSYTNRWKQKIFKPASSYIIRLSIAIWNGDFLFLNKNAFILYTFENYFTQLNWLIDHSNRWINWNHKTVFFPTLSSLLIEIGKKIITSVWKFINDEKIEIIEPNWLLIIFIIHIGKKVHEIN